MQTRGGEGDRGLLRFTTAGSVDDGKSTLIGRLLHDAKAVPHDRLAALERAAERKGETELDLSLLTDGLVAEREQGITIDVAHIYFATARRKFIIADTPGHEQYTRNMVTGASTADAAVILVDVCRGMTLQTHRHLYLSHLLGIRHLILAVNKMDLVDFSAGAFTDLAGRAADRAAAIGVRDLRCVPISAKLGDNVVRRSERMGWYRDEPLLDLLERLPTAAMQHDLPLRFPVQLVRRTATGRQYLGRIASGRLRIGDEIVVLPSGMASRVRSISTFDGPLSAAAAGQSVAVEIEDDLDISRGDLMAARAAPPALGTTLDATLCWFADEPSVPDRRYLVKSGTRSVTGRIDEAGDRLDLATLGYRCVSGPLERNVIARARIALAAPLAVDDYGENRATGSFILIDPDANATVAAGIIENRGAVSAG
jgi:sulfate adenylyltransferase large subunit